MSNIDSSKDEPLSPREKIVQVVEEFNTTKDEQRRVNNELEQEIKARLDAESQANHLHRQVQIAEVNLDTSTSKVEHATAQLIDVLKVSEVARQICTDLDKKLTAVTDKEINLDQSLSQAKESNIISDRRVQESTNKLIELQQRIEKAEQRSTVAQKRQETLEHDIRNAYVTLKTLIQNREQARLREEQYQKKIEELQSRLKSAQQRTDHAEVDVEKLQHKADKLQGQLADERKKSQQIQKNINSASQ